MKTTDPNENPAPESVGLSPLVIPVSGAGDVQIGTESVNICGSSVGLSIRVSWGSHGYAGGVIDADEVMRLRDALEEWLETNAERIVQAREYWNGRRKILKDNAKEGSPAPVTDMKDRETPTKTPDGKASGGEPA